MYLTEVVTVGDIQITRGALILVVVATLAFLVLAISVPNTWLVSMMMLAICYVIAYNMNCVVVGQCNTWAILLFFFYMIYIVVIFLASMLGMNVVKVMKGKK